MTNYYKGNAIYDELEKLPDLPFIWTSGNAWILLYADNTAVVKVVAFVSGKSTLRANKASRSRLELTHERAIAMAQDAGVASAIIQFDDESATIDSVLLNGNTVSLDELKAWFASVGLPVQGRTTDKAINNASSSAYHDWQRKNLGAIKVSDLDLLRLDAKTGRVVEMFELKRSFIALNKWSPYPADFQNFNVVVNLVDRIAARFTIAYNVRETKPLFRDDASLISRFTYSIKAGARPLGIVSLDRFLREETPE